MDKKISAWLLIVFGGIGPLLTAANVFFHPLDTEHLARSILFVVGLLSVALGVQRLGSMQEILVFVKSKKLAWLGSSEEVYARARRMVRDCRDEKGIRATDLFPYDKGEEFVTYFASIADRMEKSRLVYKLVAAVETGDGPGAKSLKLREELIGKKPSRLGDMDARCVDRTFPLEVLIVGDSVILGFPTVARDRKLTRGILIEDEQISQQFADWYDTHLFAEAKKPASKAMSP